jgi:hypothetical protein
MGDARWKMTDDGWWRAEGRWKKGVLGECFCSRGAINSTRKKANDEKRQQFDERNE